MKKFAAIFLAACLVLSLSMTSFASRYDAEAEALNSLGLFRGTDKGFELDKAMTREQGVVMIIRLLGKESEALEKNYPHPFTDFRSYTWADPYIGFAYENGISNGISETQFGYGNSMTDAMFLTMLLRVLGYVDANDGSADFVWNDPYELARRVRLTDDDEHNPFLRDDMVMVCWKALQATPKTAVTRLSDDLIRAGVFTNAGYLEAAASLNTSSNSGGGSSGGFSGSIEPKIPALYLDTANILLRPGESKSITATTENTAGAVAWTSSDPAVATVSGGVVTGVAVGTARITASIGELTKTCTVTVADKPLDENSTPWILAP